MLSNLVLPIICKKYNITCILFSLDFKVMEFTGDIKELTNNKETICVDKDIREYFWEFVGMEEEFESLLVKKDEHLHIPMIFKNDIYFDIDIELCELENKKFYVAMFTKQTRFSANYADTIRQINHETLDFEKNKKENDAKKHYYNLINQNLISFHVNENGTITEVNEACSFFFGLLEEDMLGHHFSTFFASRDSNDGIIEPETKILRAIDVNEVEVFFHVDVIPIGNEQEVSENIIICQDITYLKRVESELEYAANHDTLTGLPNRALLLKRIESLIEKNKEEELTFALCFIDLNKFKSINDNLGHHAGDMLLKHIGEVLLSVVRDCDTVARIGGDEFIILFENLGTNENFLSSTINRIQELKDEKPLKYTEETVIYFDFSLGLSIFPENGQNVKTLLNHADKKMYAQKKKS